jgi:putative copper resistance protein D
MHAYAAALGLLPAVAYAASVLQLQRRGDRWPKGRTAAFAAGTVCLAIAVGWPHTYRFEAHVAQHLLLSSLAPLLLVLGTPVTLALRTLPQGPRRALLRVLHSPLARLATNPAVVLVLVLGGLYGFYLTPLYSAAQHTRCCTSPGTRTCFWPAAC